MDEGAMMEGDRGTEEWEGDYKRGKALFFIHKTRSVVGCSGFACSVMATVGTDEIISDADVVVVRWSW